MAWENLTGVPEGLSGFSLEVSDEVLAAIEVQVAEMLKKGMMGDKHKIWHKANFYYKGKRYKKVKIRLRGDSATHWEGPKKSWRIKFSKRHDRAEPRSIDSAIASSAGGAHPSEP